MAMVTTMTWYTTSMPFFLGSHMFIVVDWNRFSLPGVSLHRKWFAACMTFARFYYIDSTRIHFLISVFIAFEIYILNAMPVNITSAALTSYSTIHIHTSQCMYTYNLFVMVRRIYIRKSKIAINWWMWDVRKGKVLIRDFFPISRGELLAVWCDILAPANSHCGCSQRKRGC